MSTSAVAFQEFRGARDDDGAQKPSSVPLPPLEEQKRIAAILDKADALRRLRRRALDRLNTLGQAIFHEMFGRDTGPGRAIGDFAHVKGGKRLPKGSDYAPQRTQHPYIRVADLGDHRISTRNLKFIAPELHKKISRYTIAEGDVVISIAGSIGVTAAVPASLSGANLTENSAKTTPKADGRFDAIYLAWALSMPVAQAQIRSRTGQVTIGKLALFRIEQIEVPLPALAAQQRFSCAIRKIEEKIELMRQGADGIDRLFSSLQRLGFQGSLLT